MLQVNRILPTHTHTPRVTWATTALLGVATGVLWGVVCCTAAPKEGVTVAPAAPATGCYRETNIYAQTNKSHYYLFVTVVWSRREKVVILFTQHHHQVEAFHATDLVRQETYTLSSHRTYQNVLTINRGLYIDCKISAVLWYILRCVLYMGMHFSHLVVRNTQ